MPSSVEAVVAECPYESQGILRRVGNMVAAVQRRGWINHVTGDVHYLALSLPNRILLTIHDCVSLNRLTGPKKSVFKLLWYTLPVWRSNLVTVVSEWTKRELLTHVNCLPGKIRVIPNCVSPEFEFFPKEFNDVKPRFLCVGTKPNKNLNRVAEALEGIRCELRIIGRPDEDLLTRLRILNIDHSSTSELTDEEIVDEYRQCDALLFPSSYEGFGLPILEAQATGRPAITSNILSMPEVAGDAAVYVDPHDVSSIRKGVLRILADRGLRGHLISKGLENTKRFRPEAIAKMYAALYNELSSLHQSVGHPGH